MRLANLHALLPFIGFDANDNTVSRIMIIVEGHEPEGAYIKHQATDKVSFQTSSLSSFRHRTSPQAQDPVIASQIHSQNSFDPGKSAP